LAVVPMMEEIYGQLLDDVKKGNETSPIFTHHIRQVESLSPSNALAYKKSEPNQLVVDYIASMTDDYFVELYQFLFPESDHKLIYKGYFD